jgi:HNH endonuclease
MANWLSAFFQSLTGRFQRFDASIAERYTTFSAYVQGDPVNATDPNGIYAEALGPAIEICAGPQATACAIIAGVVVVAIVGYECYEHCGAVFHKESDDESSTDKPVPQKDKPGTAGGDRAGKKFTKKGKREVIKGRAQETGGNPSCVDCGNDTNDTKKTEKGDKRDPRERNVDHIIDRANGGDGSPSNGAVRCFECNNKKPPRSPQ